MTRRSRVPLAVVLAIALVALAACASSDSPVSPSPQTAVAGQTAGDGQAVGVTGVVQNLNASRGTFTVAWRGGSRVVLADADTIVWSQRANSRVRIGALANGQNVSVRGSDQRRYVLAQSIVINR